jgi:hypothetical protein
VNPDCALDLLGAGVAERLAAVDQVENEIELLPLLVRVERRSEGADRGYGCGLVIESLPPAVHAGRDDGVHERRLLREEVAPDDEAVLGDVDAPPLRLVHDEVGGVGDEPAERRQLVVGRGLDQVELALDERIQALLDRDQVDLVASEARRGEHRPDLEILAFPDPDAGTRELAEVRAAPAPGAHEHDGALRHEECEKDDLARRAAQREQLRGRGDGELRSSLEDVADRGAARSAREQLERREHPRG